MPENIFHLAFWILIGFLLFIRVYFSIKVHHSGEQLMPDKGAIEREGKVMFVMRTASFFLLLALLLMYAFNVAWINTLTFLLPDWMRWFGFVIGLLSMALLTWTQAELGRQWSAQLQLRKEHHLITSGPYKRVRHPLYTSMFGIGVAFALVTANWIFIGMAILMILGLIGRVGKEEQMMIEKFGEKYKIYMQRTGRYFPRFIND